MTIKHLMAYLLRLDFGQDADVAFLVTDIHAGMKYPVSNIFAVNGSKTPKVILTVERGEPCEDGGRIAAAAAEAEEE